LVRKAKGDAESKSENRSSFWLGLTSKSINRKQQTGTRKQAPGSGKALLKIVGPARNEKKNWNGLLLVNYW
jgi:hypothetical protein